MQAICRPLRYESSRCRLLVIAGSTWAGARPVWLWLPVVVGVPGLVDRSGGSCQGCLVQGCLIRCSHCMCGAVEERKGEKRKDK